MPAGLLPCFRPLARIIPAQEEPLYEKATGKTDNQPVTDRLFAATPGKSQYANWEGDDYLSAYKDLDYLINCIYQPSFYFN